MGKWLKIMIGLMIFIGAMMVSGCGSTPLDEPPISQDEENMEADDMDKHESIHSEQETDDPVIEQESNDSGDEDDASDNDMDQETITDTGRFVGLIDEEHVVIKITGVPEQIASKNFLVNQKTLQKMQEIEFQEDDWVKFEYYVNDNGENCIVEMTKMES